MGVGTILVESRDRPAIESYCKRNDARGKCYLPHYGGADEPHRAVVQVDCSSRLRCSKCHIETCSACTQIQFVVNLDSSKRNMCIGCMGMSVWEYVAKREIQYSGAGDDKRTGLVLITSRSSDDLISFIETREHCFLPGYAEDDVYSAIVKETQSPMLCGRCGREEYPSVGRHYVVDIDSGKTLCSGCSGHDVWSYLAERHHENIRTRLHQSLPSPETYKKVGVKRPNPGAINEHLECWARIIREKVPTPELDALVETVRSPRIPNHSIGAYAAISRDKLLLYMELAHEAGKEANVWINRKGMFGAAYSNKHSYDVNFNCPAASLKKLRTNGTDTGFYQKVWSDPMYPQSKPYTWDKAFVFDTAKAVKFLRSLPDCTVEVMGMEGRAVLAADGRIEPVANKEDTVSKQTQHRERKPLTFAGDADALRMAVNAVCSITDMKDASQIGMHDRGSLVISISDPKNGPAVIKTDMPTSGEHSYLISLGTIRSVMRAAGNAAFTAALSYFPTFKFRHVWYSLYDHAEKIDNDQFIDRLLYAGTVPDITVGLDGLLKAIPNSRQAQQATLVLNKRGLTVNVEGGAANGTLHSETPVSGRLATSKATFDIDTKRARRALRQLGGKMVRLCIQPDGLMATDGRLHFIL